MTKHKSNKWKRWFRASQYEPDELEMRLQLGCQLMKFPYTDWEKIIQYNEFRDHMLEEIERQRIQIIVGQNWDRISEKIQGEQ